MGEHEHVRNIGLDIVFTILTCGIFNFFVQYQQIRAVNDMLDEDRYRFWMWFLLVLVTCGIYHIYHEYKKSLDIAEVCGRPSGEDGLVSVLLTVFGLAFVADAIQQTHINAYYGDDSV